MNKKAILIIIFLFLQIFLSFAGTSPDPNYEPPGVTRSELKGKNPDIQVLYDVKYKHISLQDYIKGVVAAEIGSKWSLDIEKKVYKAQAIASKGFALQLLKTRGKGGSLKTNTHDQAYVNLDESGLKPKYKNAISTAVNDTQDE